jgi:CrcB protein
MKLLIIGCGGFVGAILRYLISGWVYTLSGGHFPLGTLVVNLTGSLLLGLVLGLADHLVLHPQVALFLTIGLLGAFTTFSTFSYETWALVEVGSYGKALLNTAGSLLLGLIAVVVGLTVGRGF